jgi:spore maturation protein CgeB
MLLQRFPGADRLFEDGNHAVLFDGASDLIPRLEALDVNAPERERIANNGRRLHAQKHTLAHHILSIARQVKGISPGFSGWL